MIAYAYDLNGNLTRRQDALGVVTCYTLSVSATPPVVYCHDGQTYSNGACAGSAVTAELGRLTASTQRTAGMDPRAFTYSHFAGDAGGGWYRPAKPTRAASCIGRTGV